MRNCWKYIRFTQASNVAQNAFHSWKKSSILKRQQIMLNLQALIKENMVIKFNPGQTC
jgi:acyl-CoA reductase-like NAD-dependent aldehyde dehydrogenase